MNKKSYYIVPLCDIVAAATDQQLLSVSGLNGATDQDDLGTIGDGGDNDEGAPGPSSKGMNLWDGWE